jgi:polyhydroxybutyrate depolymerase
LPACKGDDSGISAPSGERGLSSPVPGDFTRTFTHDGRKRTYILHVPPSLDGSAPYAVVLVFHGGSGNAQSAIEISGFNEVADAHGFTPFGSA